jgi:hypothetical protein
MVRESKEATPNVIKRAPASAVSHGRRVAGGRWARRGCALAKLLKPGTKAFRPVFLIRENAVDTKNLLSCDFAAFINAALSWKPPNRHFHHCQRKPRDCLRHRLHRCRILSRRMCAPGRMRWRRHAPCRA